MMKTAIIAAVAMAGGAALGFLICHASMAYFHQRIRCLRAQVRADKPKGKMGTMDKVLILEGVILVAYTAADLAVFWHTGNEPATLTACVFGVCGFENGVMGWIKTTKEKVRDRRWEQEDRERMRKEEQEAQNNG